jgi:hypothetical protein
MNPENSKNLSHKPDDERNRDAQNYHRGYREIKPYIFFLNPDITRQMADPVQPVTGKINDETGNDENYTCDYHDLT